MQTNENNENDIAIRCESTGRLLARANCQGVYLFCRQHNIQHLITWQKIKDLEKNISLLKKCTI